MFVDSHPDGLVITDAGGPPRLGRSIGGLGRLLAIVVVLLVAAMSAGLLALIE
ncbi:MAG: hypothetical protein ACXWJA_17940 [Caldimonas sp.]